jgi:hypothetical protein
VIVEQLRRKHHKKQEECTSMCELDGMIIMYYCKTYERVNA